MIDIKKVRGDIQEQINSEEVKNKIASDLNIKLNKLGKCLCFKHNESDPSMSFDKKGKTFRCFSCGATYNIIDHYMEYYHKALAIREKVLGSNHPYTKIVAENIQYCTEVLKHTTT